MDVHRTAAPAIRPTRHKFNISDGTCEYMEVYLMTPDEYDHWPHRGQRNISVRPLATPFGPMLHAVRLTLG